MPPATMQYTSQAIVLWANDLIQIAANLQGKRIAAGDGANSRTHQQPRFITLDPPLQAGSRLILIAHGDPGSTTLFGLENLNPRLTACLIGYWLGFRPNNNQWTGGTRIRRVSLHMCFAGGNLTGRENNGVRVEAVNSFAYHMAGYCGRFTQDITARAETVNVTVTSNLRTGAFRDAERIVGPARRHHATGDKIVFRPNPNSDPHHEMQPTWEAFNYGT